MSGLGPCGTQGQTTSWPCGTQGRRVSGLTARRDEKVLAVWHAGPTDSGRVALKGTSSGLESHMHSTILALSAAQPKRTVADYGAVGVGGRRISEMSGKEGVLVVWR